MEYSAILKQIMATGDFNQVELAKRLRVTQPTVSRWLEGAQPKVDQHNRILAEARRLGVLEEANGEPLETAAPVPAIPTVRVVGYVGAGAEAHFYAVSQGDLDEVPAPEGATENTVAVEVRGHSLGSMFDRWLVFYDDVRRPVTADLVGRLCVVGLETGQILVKKLRRSRERGLFDLESENEPTISGMAIEWAAPVKAMTPR